MSKTEKLYNEEEKNLFLDYFVYKGDLVKTKFRQYLESYIRANGVEVEDHLKKPQVYHPSYGTNEKPNQLQRNHWIYDSHHMLWDKYTRDNVLTHVLPLLLDSPDINMSDFKFSKIIASIKNMNKLHPNWEHKNKEGNTAIHIICQKGHYFVAKRLIEEFNLNRDIKNKNGDYYTFLLVHPDTKNMLHPGWIIEEFKKNQSHFEKASMNKLIEIKSNIENLKKIEYEDYLKIKFSKRPDQETIEKSIAEKFKPLDDFLNHYYMQKVFSQSQNAIAAKKKL